MIAFSGFLSSWLNVALISSMKLCSAFAWSYRIRSEMLMIWITFFSLSLIFRVLILIWTYLFFFESSYWLSWLVIINICAFTCWGSACNTWLMLNNSLFWNSKLSELVSFLIYGFNNFISRNCWEHGSLSSSTSRFLKHLFILMQSALKAPTYCLFSSTEGSVSI